MGLQVYTSSVEIIQIFLPFATSTFLGHTDAVGLTLASTLVKTGRGVSQNEKLTIMFSMSKTHITPI